MKNLAEAWVPRFVILDHVLSTTYAWHHPPSS